MDPKLRELLSELERFGASNDTAESNRAKKMLNLESDTARLVAILARSSAATRVLEIGTSNGYSTIWLAWSVGPAGGRVVSIERDARKHAMAQENLTRAGFYDRVDLRLGDATMIVREISGPFDLVFFDADRVSAPNNCVYSCRSYRRACSCSRITCYPTRRRSPRIWNLFRISRSSSTWSFPLERA